MVCGLVEHENLDKMTLLNCSSALKLLFPLLHAEWSIFLQDNCIHATCHLVSLTICKAQCFKTVWDRKIISVAERRVIAHGSWWESKGRRAKLF